MARQVLTAIELRRYRVGIDRDDLPQQASET
jgi:hypothetical protein